MIGKQIFVGTEAEGPIKGRLTMFFPCGSIVPSKIPKLLEKIITLNVSRFYFGAGDRTGITEQEYLFIKLLKHEVFKKKDCVILLEFTQKDIKRNEIWLNEIWDFVELIYVVRHPNLTFPISHHKFVNDEFVCWHTISQVYANKLTDKNYETDNVLKL